ncbi:hypothetical protein NQ318_020679 [Aromia moschata]|uniref:Protein phosphatase methylesterase 1 n=1 Tax=Aromia moschata TaxID=1265417 RepID=A0AAV8XX79_9CUCU|nr:hypothetical protein NQ318_020679 [Aromia moschata]
MADLRKSVLGVHAKRTGLVGATKQNFTPIKWTDYFDKEETVQTAHGNFHVYSKGDEGPILLCLHGRRDVVDITNILLEKVDAPIVLMGHSMGGAVAVEAAYHIKSVLGLCVIDVVEGTALDSVIIYANYKGGQTHNLEAARVSMPGQIVNMKTGKLAANECDNIDLQSIELTASSHRELIASPYTLTEVAEEVDEKEEIVVNLLYQKSQKTDIFKTPNNPKPEDDGPQYAWRIDLSKTEPFWTGWFKGLSQKFLDIRIPKLLLLANIHGLDTTLTVGQMQGKFQMQVLARSGHAIHEDQPHNVAEIVSGYLVKQKLAEPKSAYVHPTMPAC